jgi:hypothetical protein
MIHELGSVAAEVVTRNRFLAYSKSEYLVTVRL